MSSTTVSFTGATIASTSFGRPRLISQILMMTRRSLTDLIRMPSAVIPGVMISSFLLFIFRASFGGTAAFLPDLQGVDYIAFLLPFTLVSSMLDSPGGQLMVRDIEGGYFSKISLTPVRRSALVLGHILASGLVVVLVSSIILTLGLILGLRPAGGPISLLAVLVFALMIGTGFAGFTVGVALRTGSAAATQGASFAFFPLSFLSTAFFPLDYLEGWLRTVARLNPVTYILQALRSLLIVGWEPDVLLLGLAASAAISILPFVFALTGLRARTKKG